ncbi:hypothetical protein PBRA_008878 [Plasmodiophora brassicae]|uniref:Sister chromatid cohesion protein n=1 Tax=Plasmodiophora brassicae TaxID=37360 RepID=A0A0G4J4K8_PLABS|nr:hypothetical protein PBRA_008878 [Plasmodiophora brassicae]
MPGAGVPACEPIDVALEMMSAAPLPIAQAVPMPTAPFPGALPTSSSCLVDTAAMEALLASTPIQDRSSTDVIKDPCVKLGPGALRVVEAYREQLSSTGGGQPHPPSSPVPRTPKSKSRSRRSTLSSARVTPPAVVNLADYVEAFVTKMMGVRPQDIPLGSQSGKFSLSALCWLTLLSHARRDQTVSELPVSVVSDLFSLIVSQIDASIDVSVHDVNPTTKAAAMENLQKAIAASSVALVVMSAPGVNRALVVEEIVEKTVRMLKVHLSRTVAPIFDKTRRVQNGGPPESYWAESSGAFGALCRNVCSLFERLFEFLKSEPASDAIVVSLVSAYFSLPQSATELQLAGINLVEVAFLRNPTVRDTIIEEVAGRIAGTERSERRRVYRVGDSGSIQAMVALGMLVVQDLALLCVNRAQSGNGFEECVMAPLALSDKFCRTLVVLIVNQAFRPGMSVLDSRNVVHDFVDDILKCLFSPEWPVAQYLLHNVLHVMRNFLLNSNYPSAKRIVAIELTGYVLSHLQPQIASVNADSQIIRQRVTEFNPEGTILTDATEKIGCECGRGPNPNELMLDCDECHHWFHGSCAQVSFDRMPQSWICEPCSLRVYVQEQQLTMKRALSKDSPSSHNEGPAGGNVSDDETHDMILPQILVNFLTKHRSQYQMLGARQYALADWARQLREASSGKELDVFNLQWDPNNLPPALRLWGEDSGTTTRDKLRRIARVMSRSSGLLKDQENFVKAVINCSHEKQPSMRSRVVKAMCSIVDTDAALLEHDFVLHSIQDAVQDVSTSVREAAVELLGKKVLARSSLSEKYYEIIAARLRDKGLSVRKRCVKILRDICLLMPSHSMYVKICTMLISRSRDEPSIRSLVIQSFRQMWFESFLRQQSRIAVASIASGDGLHQFADEFRMVSKHIVDVVGQLPATDWLVDLISSLSATPADGAASGGPVFDVCIDLCSCIVQQLISEQAEERTYYARIRTLHVFCSACPTFLAKHASILLPLIKVDNIAHGEEQQGLSLLCEIMFMCLVITESPRIAFLEKLVRDLRTLILQQGTAVLRTAIPCLCAASRKTDVPGLVAVPRQLLMSFCQYLRQNASGAASHEARVKRSLLRSLFSIGLLVRYFDFDEGTGAHATSESAVDVYRSYLHHVDEVIRRVALQGLVFVYSRLPALMLSTSSELRAAVASPTPSVKAQALQSLADFLQNEDDLVQYLQDSNKTSRPSARDSAPGCNGADDLTAEDQQRRRQSGLLSLASLLRCANESESGVISGVMNQLLPDLLVLALSPSPEVRHGFLSLSRQLLAQRICNPSSCAAPVIALCGDTRGELRELALEQLSSLSRAYPSVIRQGFLPALRLLHRLHTALAPMAADEMTTSLEGVSRFYRLLCKVSTDTSSLLAALVDVCDVVAPNDDGDDEQRRVALLPVAFVARILSCLPYRNDEPLHAIYHLQRHIEIVGAPVDSVLRTAFKYELLQENAGATPDQIGRLARFVDVCDDLTVLIRLKHYLQTKSAIACSATEVPPFDVGSRTSDAGDIESLKARYLSFKACFENDTSDVRLQYVAGGKRRAKSSPAPSRHNTPKRQQADAVTPRRNQRRASVQVASLLRDTAGDDRDSNNGIGDDDEEYTPVRKRPRASFRIPS